MINFWAILVLIALGVFVVFEIILISDAKTFKRTHPVDKDTKFFHRFFIHRILKMRKKGLL